jgi:hypothetical protein
MSGLGVIGLLGALLLAGSGCRRHHAGAGEKAGSTLDARLKEAMAALDTASVHVRSVVEHLKSKLS